MEGTVQFKGCNKRYGAPKIMDELECQPAVGFDNGKGQHALCVKLTKFEIQKIHETGVIWLLLYSGNQTIPPFFLGDEEAVRSMMADKGVWKK